MKFGNHFGSGSFEYESGNLGEATVNVFEFSIDALLLWSAPPAGTQGESGDGGQRGTDRGKGKCFGFVAGRANLNVCIMHWLGGVVDRDVERSDIEADRLDTHEYVKETVGVNGKGDGAR